MRKKTIGMISACIFLAGLVIPGCSRTPETRSHSGSEVFQTGQSSVPEKKETEAPEETPVPTEDPQQSAEGEAEDPVPAANQDPEAEIREYLSRMTAEEKAAQLFFVTPESLTGADLVTAAGETTRQAFDAIPVGGLVYMAQNLESESQVREMLENVQTYSRERLGLPVFTGVDEEGGTVTRIGGRGNFDVPWVGDMRDVGSTGDSALAYETGVTLGTYLRDLGFNVDFAPDADVLSNPENEVVRYRSFGSDPALVAEMAAAELKGLKEQGVLGCYKHFPGHGATAGDTHAGYAYTDKTLEELMSCELIPFQRGVEEGVSMIMAGHISLPPVVGDDTPASLSSTMITEVLRGQMGYDGIVITDAMNMGAISQSYSSGEAAVRAILAGADMILMPGDFSSAYAGVLEAVENQTISMERLDESVARILRVKLGLPS
ncbi:MAG TPA: glycoside hydrolase family 3 protein [Candidatus Scatomonas merdigallinarum]|nr:glycoside hydrolase family 3 protein [Candidatus Scatomonas merdigallinarum]